MPTPEFFPVAIGAYEEHETLDVEPELAKVASLFAEFGAVEVPWGVPMAERGGDAVDRRLRGWSRPDAASDSVLYWLGHGWSDGFDVTLAHARSPAAVRASGWLPAQLAEPLRARQAVAGEHWAIVIVDTCWSSRFVDRLNADLAAGVLGADRVLLVGVSGDGSTSLGRFSTALRQCLSENFGAEERIELWRLAAELDRRLTTGLVVGRRLGKAALVRRVSPLAAAVRLPLDLMRELESALSGLTTDERTHFVNKARSAQESELSWFFEGRSAESAQVVRWLRTASSGLLIVTGRAGSGKSALLGQLLVHSIPDLRSVLVRSKLVDAPPSEQQPPDSVFDAAIHLTGMTLDVLVRRIADVASFDLPASPAGPADVLDRLVEHLQSRARPLTLLLDALDEADEPLVVARTVVRRLAAIPGVRVVVGSRASTHESLLQPEPEDEDLLDALTAATPQGFARLVWMAPDSDAVERYVTRRLSIARARDALDVDGRQVTDEHVTAAAKLIRQRESNFLYAHLAVHEILAEPRLLTATQTEFGLALPADHRGLFAHAVARLDGRSAAFVPLAEALAWGRGRGVPIVDGVWATMASALSGAPVSDENISAFLEAARPYITVDREGGQTVFRLAHRVFAEHFLGRDGADARQLALSRGLIGLTARSDVASPYVVAHLSGHVADAGSWLELADALPVLDRLDPLAVTADALRTAFGGAELPLPVGAVIHARHQLAQAAARDRAGLRQLASAALGGHAFDEATGAERPWVVEAAQLTRVALHITLPGHTGYVTGLAFLDDARVGRVLASAGDDGTIRLWDPATGLPTGAPMSGHRGSVSSICPVPGPGGRAVLASAGSDGSVRFWDPATALPIGAPLFGHDHGVASVCALPGTGGRTIVASGGGDGMLRLWDVSTTAQIGPPLSGHDGPVVEVCTVPLADGRILIASTGADSTVRLWDPETAGPVGEPLRGHTGVVTAVCAVPGIDGRTLLASSGDDRSIRLWDPVTGVAVGQPLTGHTGGVEALSLVGGLQGRNLLVSAGADGTVRLWDPAAMAPLGVPLSSMAGALWAVSAASSGDGRAWVATAGEDGSVRLWDLSAALTEDEPPTLTPGLVAAVASAGYADGHTDLVSMTMDGKVCRWDAATLLPAGFATVVEPGLVVMARVVTVDGEPLLVSAEHDGTVRRWDLSTLATYGEPLRGHEGPVLALASVRGPDGAELIASGGADGTVRLWDPAGEGPARMVLTGHTAAIRAFSVVEDPDGRPLLASGDMDGVVRLWDLDRGAAAAAPIATHAGPVLALASPGPRALAIAAVDGSIRSWDVTTGMALGAPFAAHPSVIRAMCAVPPWLASAGTDGQVRLSDSSLSGEGVDLARHGLTVRDLCALDLPGGRHLLASGGHDGSVRVWEPATRAPVGAPLGGRPESVEVIATVTGPGSIPLRVIAGESGRARLWSPSASTQRVLDVGHVVTAMAAWRSGGSAVVVGGSDGWLAVVNAQDGSLIGESAVAEGGVAVVALCLLPGTEVALGTADGGLWTWDPATGLVRRRVAELHDGPIRAVWASSDACLLVTAGQDGTIRLVDARTWTPSGSVMTGHLGWVWAVTANADDVVASGGADGSVRLWDMREAKPLGPPLLAHTDQVRAVRFLTEAVLASAGHDGTVRIWDTRRRRLLDTLPLGIPVHVLDHSGDAVLTVGTAEGVLDLTLHDALLAPR